MGKFHYKRWVTENKYGLLAEQQNTGSQGCCDPSALNYNASATGSGGTCLDCTCIGLVNGVIVSGSYFAGCNEATGSATGSVNATTGSATGSANATTGSATTGSATGSGGATTGSGGGGTTSGTAPTEDPCEEFSTRMDRREQDDICDRCEQDPDYSEMCRCCDDRGRRGGRGRRQESYKLKNPLIERFQQLAGIKPLYEQEDPRRPKDIEFDNAQAMDKLTPDDRDKVGKIQQMMKGERKEYEKVTFVYTEQGGQFYGLDVYVSKDQDQRSDKLGYDDANEWLKNTLDLGLDMDMIPRRYGSGMEELDDIVEKLEDLGIEASHHDFMDVSETQQLNEADQDCECGATCQEGRCPEGEYCNQGECTTMFPSDPWDVDKTVDTGDVKTMFKMGKEQLNENKTFNCNNSCHNCNRNNEQPLCAPGEIPTTVSSNWNGTSHVCSCTGQVSGPTDHGGGVTRGKTAQTPKINPKALKEAIKKLLKK